MGFKFFVYHDEEGNITSITNEKRSTGEYIEAEESEISDFLNGVKDFTKFKINSLSSGSKQIKLTHDSSAIVYKDFYIVSNSIENEQVIITHNNKTKSWNIKLNDDAQLLTFSFYVCRKDNLNFLIREVTVPPKKTFSIPFSYVVEQQSDELIVLAKRVHESYGINYV